MYFKQDAITQMGFTLKQAQVIMAVAAMGSVLQFSDNKLYELCEVAIPAKNSDTKAGDIHHKELCSASVAKALESKGVLSPRVVDPTSEKLTTEWTFNPSSVFASLADSLAAERTAREALDDTRRKHESLVYGLRQKHSSVVDWHIADKNTFAQKAAQELSITIASYEEQIAIMVSDRDGEVRQAEGYSHGFERAFEMLADRAQGSVTNNSYAMPDTSAKDAKITQLESTVRELSQPLSHGPFSILPSYAAERAYALSLYECSDDRQEAAHVLDQYLNGNMDIDELVKELEDDG